MPTAIDLVKDELTKTIARRNEVGKEMAEYEALIEELRGTMSKYDDTISVCKVMLAAVDSSAPEAPRLPAENYANPEVMTLRWERGEVRSVVLNTLGRASKPMRQCEIVKDVFQTHKRRVPSPTISHVLAVMVKSGEIGYGAVRGTYVARKAV